MEVINKRNLCDEKRANRVNRKTRSFKRAEFTRELVMSSLHV